MVGMDSMANLTLAPVTKFKNEIDACKSSEPTGYNGQGLSAIHNRPRISKVDEGKSDCFGHVVDHLLDGNTLRKCDGVIAVQCSSRSRKLKFYGPMLGCCDIPELINRFNCDVGIIIDRARCARGAEDAICWRKNEKLSGRS